MASLPCESEHKQVSPATSETDFHTLHTRGVFLSRAPSSNVEPGTMGQRTQAIFLAGVLGFFYLNSLDVPALRPGRPVRRLSPQRNDYAAW